MNKNETLDSPESAKNRRSRKDAFFSVTVPAPLLAKIDTVRKAQGISRSKYVRDLLIADLLRLKIPVAPEEIAFAQGMRSDISDERRAQIAAAKAARERRLIERVKKTFKELPLDLQDFYKNRRQS